MKYEKTAVSVVLVSFPSIVFGGLLPIYTNLLGYTTLEMTILFSVFSLSSLLMKLIMGKVSDRYNRYSVFLCALFMYGVSYIIFSVAQSLLYLLLARIVQGGASVLLTISVMGMIVSENKRLAESIGRFGESVNQGGFIGMCILSLIFSKYYFLEGWKIFYCVCAAGALAAFFYAMSFKRFSNTQIQSGQLEKPVQPVPLQLDSLLRKKLWILNFCYCTLVSMVMVLIIPYLQTVYHADMKVIALVFYFPVFCSSFLNSKMGRLGERLGYRRTILISTVLAPVMIVFLILRPALVWVGVVWTVFDLLIAAQDISLVAYFLKGMSDENSGDSYGKYMAGSNIGAIIGPVVGGLFYDYLGINSPYITFVVLMFCLCILAAYLLPNQERLAEII